MKLIEWSHDKNQQIQKNRNLSFEAIVIAIEQGKLISIILNPKKDYSHQNILVVEIDNYLVLAPFIEDDEKIFLKTDFRSRKVMKLHTRGLKNET